MEIVVDLDGESSVAVELVHHDVDGVFGRAGEVGEVILERGGHSFTKRRNPNVSPVALGSAEGGEVEGQLGRAAAKVEHVVRSHINNAVTASFEGRHYMGVAEEDSVGISADGVSGWWSSTIRSVAGVIHKLKVCRAVAAVDQDVPIAWFPGERGARHIHDVERIRGRCSSGQHLSSGVSHGGHRCVGLGEIGDVTDDVFVAGSVGVRSDDHRRANQTVFGF